MAQYTINAELTAEKIIKKDGTDQQFLMANGDVTEMSATAVKGNEADVTLTNGVFNFTLPKGDPGSNGTNAEITGATATATTVASGNNATANVSLNGTSLKREFEFTFQIPKGDPGSNGSDGRNGGIWYAGVGVIGTSATATVFSGSGVSSAVIGDMYLNTSTYNTYKCTTAGNASTAKWIYVCNIKGAPGPEGPEGPQGPEGKSGAEFKYTNSSPMPATVGGLAKGTTFDAEPLNDLLNSLLYPYVKFSWSVSATPNVFEYGTKPASIVFKATVTKGSKDYTITHGGTTTAKNPGSATYTQTPTANLTADQSYQFTVQDDTNTESKTATSPVGYCVKLFYSSVALANLTADNIPSDILWTKNASNQSVSATSAAEQYLYFVCPKSWWEDGKTLSSSVGPVIAGATREITRNTCSYTVAYIGRFSGTSSYTVNKS